MLRERCRIEQAERILGLGRRQIEKMAATGKIPGAIKFGRRWTFDLIELGQFVEAEKERQWLQRNVPKPQPGVIGAAALSGVARASVARTSAGHLRQTIRELLRNVTRPGKTAS
jgi:hypothetical protein